MKNSFIVNFWARSYKITYLYSVILLFNLSSIWVYNYLFCTCALGRLKEDGKQKCHEYWDDECEITVTMDNRSIKINVLDVEPLECGLVRRTLQIQSSDKDKVRVLNIYIHFAIISSPPFKISKTPKMGKYL